MNEPAKSFEDLLVWQKSHEHVLKIYQLTEAFPKSELYGLTSQYRRAAVSVAANIAEGFKKRGGRDKIRFVNIAQGSLEECKYYSVLAADLKYVESRPFVSETIRISKLLSGYRKSIERGLKYIFKFLFFLCRMPYAVCRILNYPTSISSLSFLFTSVMIVYSATSS
ncbi:four helix bundle protein [Balneola sp. MJW-20]|uniref:four helix bundle protein n=1 Tax=Gracilimonas aurantiaca TaxID=3234185 RepID=UPI0038B3E495